MQLRSARSPLPWVLAGCLAGAVWAADPAPASNAPASSSEVQQLKEQIAKQQEQIQTLISALEDQKKALERLESGKTAAAPAPVPQHTTPPDRLAASAVPMALPPALPPAPAASPFPSPTPAPAPAPTPQEALPPGTHAPLQLQLGNISIMPVGFADATFVWRNVNAGSGIGSSFGSIPYSNTVAGKLSESRFSIQNSRLGFRIDGNWKGAHFIGYNEFDFLGTSGSNAIGVTNGAFVPRIRLYWIDMRKNQWEFLAGQSWSMLTPNRVGISPLPSDLFYSQVMDVNYLIGMPWTRQMSFRGLYHPSDKVTVGLSLENPNQYMGGSSGGPQIVLPAALSAVAGAQLDNTSASYLSTPNVHPDIIAKIAFDPSRRVHFEIAGIERDFKIANPTTLQTFGATGAGGSFNFNVEVVKHLRLISNNFYSDGGGRYMFGQAPDVIVRPDGSLSPVHSSGLNDGFEAQVSPNTLLWAYYGAAFTQKDVTIDTNGKPVGYGYVGSANSQNRNIQEATFGLTQTFWKDPRYGALSAIFQYEYLTRRPWYVAPGSLSSTNDSTVYFDLRYTLPGGAPPAEK